MSEGIYTGPPFTVPAILSLLALAELGILPIVRRPFEALERSSGSIAAGNRHGGPHQHRREIARRRRQAQARAA